MQECCIFLNAFSLLSRLTPSGPKFLYTFSVGADARHRPARADACLRGDASIAPYSPLYHWYCREGSCPFLSRLPFIVNIKLRCRGRRPRRPGRGLRYRPWRGQDPSLQTSINDRQNPNGQQGTPAGRRGRRPLQTMAHIYCRGEHCSPVNLEVRQTAAGAHCAPLHPL